MTIKTTRQPHDYYPTPRPLVNAALTLLGDTNPATVVDVGAGCGRWGHAARVRWPNAHITGYELRPVPHAPGYDRWVIADALAVPVPSVVDLVLSNPPFSLAEPLLRRWLPVAHVALALLPFGFYGAECRRAFWQSYPPSLVALLRPRPSFTGQGTDARDSALFIWHAGHNGPAQLTHLDGPPKWAETGTNGREVTHKRAKVGQT